MPDKVNRTEKKQLFIEGNDNKYECICQPNDKKECKKTELLKKICDTPKIVNYQKKYFQTVKLYMQKKTEAVNTRIHHLLNNKQSPTAFAYGGLFLGKRT